ncbi:MAG: YihY/virulence factor BrkB family protein [Pseudomonadota bacterium]
MILRAVRSVWTFCGAVLSRFNEDQGSVLAGYLAYAAMLSLLPFLVFATALAGFIVGPENSEKALETLFAGVPDHVVRTLEPAILEVLAHRRGGILTLSAIGSVWAASNGIEALRVGFDHAYEAHEKRSILINRLYAILAVFLCYAIFWLLAFLLILAPILFHVLESLIGIDVPVEAEYLRHVIGLVILWSGLWVLHRMLPSRIMSGIRLWPGLTVSVALWLLIAKGMSVYLYHAPSYSLTYGALAGVILTLLFFYLTGVALIIGAQVNAVVNAALLRPRERPNHETAQTS